MAIASTTVPTIPASWELTKDPLLWQWEDLPALTPFTLADGSGPAIQQTVARVGHDSEALYVHYTCADSDIWGTYTQRDEPIYDEEVVEIFIGVGTDQPIDYYEFQVSPTGVLLDARIHNPHERREDIVVEFTWDCPGIRWGAQINGEAGHWDAFLIIPWKSICTSDGYPTQWRANFYRIERPRNSQDEYSCWSPTMTEPADFHKPSRFGLLEIG